MKKAIPSLTDDEVEILRRGKNNPSIITDYFFRKPGSEHGWIFDYNFDPEGAWQELLHKASQKRIIVIGGFGSGKTKGVAMSACVWCTTTTDFAFMNCAPKAWQSELMWRFIIDMSRNTPFERLIYEMPKRPFPKIELRFWVHNVLVVSTMEFMSVDKNASAILGWEGDWANIDEAGQLDDLGDTITNLGSRMRGAVNGRERLGRLSMISNSWDNPDMWYRFDLAASWPEDFLSLTVSTRHNHNVSDNQLRLMLKDIPESEHERFIDGTRPEGRGNYFSKSKVFACEDETYAKFITEAVKGSADGYFLETIHGAGTVFMRIPPSKEGMYVLVGDPGVGDAPNRNAPALMVWNVTEFPMERATLAAFWWGSGRGSITPFIHMLLTFMVDYHPMFTGVDSTGPQKNTNEILNTYIKSQRLDKDQTNQWLGNVDLSKLVNTTVGGLDFSGFKKPAYLIAGRMLIEAGLLAWPKLIHGLRSQLTNYDPAKDRIGEPKIAQDLVACLCMAAHTIRVLFHWESQEVREEEITGDTRLSIAPIRSTQRLPSSARTARIGRNSLDANPKTTR